MKLMDVIIQIIFFLGIIFASILVYGSYKEQNFKADFDKHCFEAGGIPLRSTYLYDKKQNRIEYVCLSVNAVIDGIE